MLFNSKQFYKLIINSKSQASRGYNFKVSNSQAYIESLNTLGIINSPNNLYYS